MFFLGTCLSVDCNWSSLLIIYVIVRVSTSFVSNSRRNFMFTSLYVSRQLALEDAIFVYNRIKHLQHFPCTLSHTVVVAQVSLLLLAGHSEPAGTSAANVIPVPTNMSLDFC